MKNSFLALMGLAVAILLIGSNSLALAQSNKINQTLELLNSSDAQGQANLSTSNMSNITTPEGDVNTYR
ncbi:MAG: hypothetical protein AB7U98_01030 [Candidatus Nitrosocosmicus sp.]|jgi:hypothetical protein|uniref:hypothetical protein n=1 Tax=Candidatus Nitrosocosmicus sp. FF01 TaxID=3397670 RepID=UPI002A6EC10C|nr:hypothetical protein [Candidatus Nitrosocosmicus sp.]